MGACLRRVLVQVCVGGSRRRGPEEVLVGQCRCRAWGNVKA